MSGAAGRRMKRQLCVAGAIAAVVVGGGAPAGCTRESVRAALAVQRRADSVQQAVFEQQHETLCILLYRDLIRRLEHGGAQLTAAQRAALNEVWNERDLIEFWCVQQERCKALRLIGVDSKLFADQSPVDLLLKQLVGGLRRVEQGLAGQVAESLVAPQQDERGP